MAATALEVSTGRGFLANMRGEVRAFHLGHSLKPMMRFTTLPAGGPAFSLAIDSQKEVIWAGLRDRTVLALSARTGDTAERYGLHTGWVSTLLPLPGGGVLAGSCGQMTLWPEGRVHDFASGDILSAVIAGEEDEVVVAGTALGVVLEISVSGMKAGRSRECLASRVRAVASTRSFILAAGDDECLIYALGSKQALARDGLGGSRALDATPFQGKSMFAVACSDGCIRAIRLLSEEGGSSVSVIACLDHAVPRRIRWMAKEGASLLVGTSSGSLERVDILHPEDVR